MAMYDDWLKEQQQKAGANPAMAAGYQAGEQLKATLSPAQLAQTQGYAVGELLKSVVAPHRIAPIASPAALSPAPVVGPSAPMTVKQLIQAGSPIPVPNVSNGQGMGAGSQSLMQTTPGQYTSPQINQAQAAQALIRRIQADAGGRSVPPPAPPSPVATPNPGDIESILKARQAPIQPAGDPPVINTAADLNNAATSSIAQTNTVAPTTADQALRAAAAQMLVHRIQQNSGGRDAPAPIHTAGDLMGGGNPLASLSGVIPAVVGAAKTAGNIAGYGADAAGQVAGGVAHTAGDVAGNVASGIKDRAVMTAKDEAAAFKPAVEQIIHPVRTAQGILSSASDPIGTAESAFDTAKGIIGQAGQDIRKPQQYVENLQAELAYKALTGDRTAQAAVSILRGNSPIGAIGSELGLSGKTEDALNASGQVSGGMTSVPGMLFDKGSSLLGMNMFTWADANQDAVKIAYTQGYTKKDKDGKVIETYPPGAGAVTAMFNDSMNFLQSMGYQTLTDPLLYASLGAGPATRLLEGAAGAEDAGLATKVIAGGLAKGTGAVDTITNKLPEQAVHGAIHLIPNAVDAGAGLIHAAEDAVPALKNVTDLADPLTNAVKGAAGSVKDYFDPLKNPANQVNILRKEAGNALATAADYIKGHSISPPDTGAGTTPFDDIAPPAAPSSAAGGGFTTGGTTEFGAPADVPAAAAPATATATKPNIDYLLPKEGGTRSIDTISPETYNAIKTPYENLATQHAAAQANLDAMQMGLSATDEISNRVQKVFNDMQFKNATDDLITNAGGAPIEGFTPRYGDKIPTDVLGSDGVWDAGDRARAQSWITQWMSNHNGAILGDAVRGSTRDEILGLAEVALGPDPVAANDVRALFRGALPKTDPNYSAVKGIADDLLAKRVQLYGDAARGATRGEMAAQAVKDDITGGAKATNVSPTYRPVVPGTSASGSKNFFDVTMEDGSTKRVGSFAGPGDATTARDDLLSTHAATHGPDAAPTENPFARRPSLDNLPGVINAKTAATYIDRITEVGPLTGTGAKDDPFKFLVKFDDGTEKQVGKIANRPITSQKQIMGAYDTLAEAAKNNALTIPPAPASMVSGAEDVAAAVTPPAKYDPLVGKRPTDSRSLLGAEPPTPGSLVRPGDVRSPFADVPAAPKPFLAGDPGVDTGTPTLNRPGDVRPASPLATSNREPDLGGEGTLAPPGSTPAPDLHGTTPAEAAAPVATTPADKAAIASLPPDSGITPVEVVDRGGFTPFDDSAPRTTAGGNLGAVRSLQTGKPLPDFWNALSDEQQATYIKETNFGGKFTPKQELKGATQSTVQDAFNQHVSEGMTTNAAISQTIKDLAPTATAAEKNAIRDALTTSSKTITTSQSDLLDKTVLRNGTKAQDFFQSRIAAGDTDTQALAATRKLLPATTTGVETQAINDALKSSRVALTDAHTAALTDTQDFGGRLVKIKGKQELVGATSRPIGDVFEEHLAKGMDPDAAWQKTIDSFSPGTPFKDYSGVGGKIAKGIKNLTQFSRENKMYGLASGSGPLNVLKQEIGDSYTMAQSGHIGAVIDSLTNPAGKADILNRIENNLPDIIGSSEYAQKAARMGMAETRLAGLANRAEDTSNEMIGRSIARRMGKSVLRLSDTGADRFARVGELFGAPKIRNLLEATDINRRLAVMSETSDRELYRRLPVFQASIRDIAERTGGDAEALISGLGDEFSQEDVRRLAPQAGFEPGQVDRMARDWVNQAGAINNAAYAEQNRVLFDFSPAQSDEMIKNAFMYHTWALRAGPLYLRNALENPALMSAYLHIADDMKKDCEGRAGSTCGYLQLMADGAKGFALYNSPLSLVSSMFINLDPNYSNVSGTWVDKVLSLVPASTTPAFQGILSALALSSRTPDILGMARDAKVWGGVVEKMRSMGVFGENAKHSLGDPLYMKAMQFPQELMAKGLGEFGITKLPGGNPLGDQIDSNASKTVLMNNEMIDLVYADFNVPDNTSMSDLERNYPKAYDALMGPTGALNSWALHQPNKYADEAYRKLTTGELEQSVSTVFVPGGSLLHEQGKDARTLDAAAANAAGDTTTANNIYSISGAGQLPNSTAINLQAQSDAVHGAEVPGDQYWLDAYNAIRYDPDPTKTETVMKPDGSGEMTAADYAAMDPADRQLFADQWAASHDGINAAITRARATKKAAEANNPEYSTYASWSTTVRGFTPIELQQLMASNPNYKRYVDELPAATKADTTKFASATVSPDAYLAYSGTKGSVYDPAPISTGNINPLMTGGGSSNSSASSTTNYGDSVLKAAQTYQTAYSQYESAVQAYTGVANVDVSQLNPLLRSSVSAHLAAQGVYEPSVPADVTRYQAWSDQQAANGQPHDLQSYNDYMTSLQSNLTQAGVTMTADQMLDAMIAGYNPFTGGAMTVSSDPSSTSGGSSTVSP